MPVNVRWSENEQEMLGKSADLLAECGERGLECWALQAVLDELITKVGPWWLAHFIATTPNKAAAAALEGYLQKHWPAHAEATRQLITAADWSREASELERDFGGD